MAFALCGALALLASGCDDLNLPKSWAIAYPRVLAMRSEVVGDETRATPGPGEALRLRALIVGQKPIERLSYALEVCPALAANGDLPACAAEPFTTLDGVLGEDAPFTGELSVELDIPGDDQLEDVDQLLVIGTACSDGDARLPKNESDPGDCKGSAGPAMTWIGTIPLAHSDEDYNANPVLADDAIELDENAWPALDPAEPGESNETGPLTISVAADGELHTVRVNLSASGRERKGDQPEELLLSHFVTAGALARRFTVLEHGDADDHALEVEWHSPHPPPDKKPPERVRMVFVLRDQRGGVAFATREVAIDAK